MKKIKMIKKIASIAMTIAMVASMCSIALATGTIGGTTAQIGGEIQTGARNIIKIIVDVVTYAGYAVAIGMLIYIGIKYMMTGAGEKAKIKETLLPYLIGAVLVATAGTIVKTVFQISDKSQL